MPFTILPNSSGRVEISAGIPVIQLKDMAENKDLKVIQFSKPLDEKDLSNVYEYVLSIRSDIEFRVYGHYSGGCDLSFLKDFTQLKKFSADCLLEAKNSDYISHLKNVEELSVGIYGLTSFDFLEDINPNLTKLSIGPTFSKKPSISSLSRFKRLEYLYNEGQKNGINSINDLISLEKIVLRSITVSDLNFLKGLRNLWSVDVKLGGIKNFSALENLPGIKYLELWQVNKLSDISFISKMPDLQNLFIQSLRNIETLPSFTNCKKLRRIYLENLKGLKNLNSLRTAPALEEFIYASAQNQQLENLNPAIENNTVKQILVGFGSSKKNDIFNEIVRKSGRQIYNHREFLYE